MRRQSESSLPVTQLCFTCEYPACIRWLWVGEPRAKLLLYAQLCRRTVFTRHPRAHITSARAINTESRTINPVLQTHTACVCVCKHRIITHFHIGKYIFFKCMCVDIHMNTPGLNQQTGFISFWVCKVDILSSTVTLFYLPMICCKTYRFKSCLIKIFPNNQGRS